MPTNSAHLARLKILSKLGALTVTVLGALVLLGWHCHSVLLTRLDPALASMKANTAAAFLAAGLSLWLLSSRAGGHAALLGAILAGAVFALGGASEFEDISGLDLNIDQALFADVFAAPGAPHPGRPASATSFCFMLLGFALAIAHLGSVRWHGLVLAGAVLLAFIAMLAVIGYAFGVESLYRMTPFTSMAIHTAVAFGIMAVCLLAEVPTAGFMPIVTADTTGGYLARRLLLLIPTGLLTIGLLRLNGELSGWYDGRFGVALMVMSSIVFSMFIAIWLSGTVHRLDLKQQRYHNQVVVLNAGLDGLVKQRTLQLQDALDNVRQLTGLLPICAWCRKLRDDQNYWRSVEDFIELRTNARCTHGVCPDCRDKFLTELSLLDGVNLGRPDDAS